MSTHYAMDWSSPSQFVPNLQLEEYYLSAQGHSRPHLTPLMHTSSYPPTQYHNTSGQLQARSRSLGQNTHGYNSGASDIYDPSLSQPTTAFNSPNVNGFYNTPPYQSELSTSPSGLGAPLGLPDSLSVNGTSDGNLSPTFVSSPIPASMGFRDLPQTQRQGQSRYPIQQMVHFHPPVASGSNTGPGDLAHGHEHLHPTKRQRGLDDDDDYGGPGVDVSIDHGHEDNERHDSKDPKPKP